jgi:hypothetical protein
MKNINIHIQPPNSKTPINHSNLKPHPSPNRHKHIDTREIHITSQLRSQRTDLSSKIFRESRLPTGTHVLANNRRRGQSLLKRTILQTLNIGALRMSTRDFRVAPLIATATSSTIHRLIITPGNRSQECPAQAIPLLPIPVSILQRLRPRLPASRLRHVKFITVVTRRAVMRRDGIRAIDGVGRQRRAARLVTTG